MDNAEFKRTINGIPGNLEVVIKTGGKVRSIKEIQVEGGKIILKDRTDNDEEIRREKATQGAEILAK